MQVPPVITALSGSSVTPLTAPGGTPRTTTTPSAVLAVSFQSMLDQSVQAAIATAIPRIITTVDARVQAALAAGSTTGGSVPVPPASTFNGVNSMEQVIGLT